MAMSRRLLSSLHVVALVRHCAHSLSSGRPSIDAAPFGEHRGVPVTKWTLRGGGGALEVAVISYGATLVSARSADRAGAVDELTLNYPTLAPIVAPGFPYLGSTVGRVANRVSNARFELDGVAHALAANHFSSCLHGGPDGWGRRPWVLRDARADASGAALTLALRSADGDGGFPGAVEAEATFAVAGPELTLAWRATCDAPTPVAMTNHAYWNLAGASARRGAAEHSLHVDARARLEVDCEAVPTGAVLPVAGTPYDLRWPEGAQRALAAPKLGPRMLAADSGVARDGTPRAGFDHCFVLDPAAPERRAPARRASKPLRRAARLLDARSGRSMTVWTTQPALQVYTANFLPVSPAAADDDEPAAPSPVARHNAVCLETQHHVDAVNQRARHPELFPDTVLRPGEVYEEETVHVFEALGRDEGG